MCLVVVVRGCSAHLINHLDPTTWWAALFAANALKRDRIHLWSSHLGSLTARPSVSASSVVMTKGALGHCDCFLDEVDPSVAHTSMVVILQPSRRLFSAVVHLSFSPSLPPLPDYPRMTTLVKPRSSRRLFTTSPSSAGADESTQLALPSDCELVAGTFVVFRWEGHCCVLQVNVTLYCWGRQRSGAIEHVLDKYGLTHSPQLYRLNSRLVSSEQWSWLKQVFVVVHRLFDDKEMCETVSKVRWINLMQCGLAYDVMRRECHYYHRNLYPKGSVLTSFLKLHGVEVEPWFALSDASPDRPTTPLPSFSSASSASLEAPMSGGSDSSSGGSHHLDTSSSAAGSVVAEVRGDGSSRQAFGAREWLSDIHIANLMFLLLYGQLPIPVELRDVFQCIYPMTDQLLEQMLRRADPGSLLMHAKVGHGVTLVFINPNNNHWRLVVLDGVHRRVILFDPMGTPLPSSLRGSICEFLGPEFEVIDTQTCLQAEGWNCGIWTLHIASKYVTATVEHLSGLSSSSPMRFHLCREQDEYAVLDELATTADRQQNQRFADELRRQYSDLLVDARASGRLLYRRRHGDHR